MTAASLRGHFTWCWRYPSSHDDPLLDISPRTTHSLRARYPARHQTSFPPPPASLLLAACSPPSHSLKPASTLRLRRRLFPMPIAACSIYSQLPLCTNNLGSGPPLYLCIALCQNCRLLALFNWLSLCWSSCLDAAIPSPPGCFSPWCRKVRPRGYYHILLYALHTVGPCIFLYLLTYKLFTYMKSC